MRSSHFAQDDITFDDITFDDITFKEEDQLDRVAGILGLLCMVGCAYGRGDLLLRLSAKLCAHES
jgi:hypothetical protein